MPLSIPVQLYAAETCRALRGASAQQLKWTRKLRLTQSCTQRPHKKSYTQHPNQSRQAKGLRKSVNKLTATQNASTTKARMLSRVWMGRRGTAAECSEELLFPVQMDSADRGTASRASLACAASLGTLVKFNTHNTLVKFNRKSHDQHPLRREKQEAGAWPFSSSSVLICSCLRSLVRHNSPRHHTTQQK